MYFREVQELQECRHHTMIKNKRGFIHFVHRKHLQILYFGIVYPAVRTKEARLRVSILATHEKWQLDHLVDSLNEINKILNVTNRGF